MSSTTSPVRLTAPQRFTRGLKYSTVGPVDITRGALGVGLNSVRSSAAWAGGRYRRSRLESRRHPRPIVVIGVGAAVLAVGAVAFSIIRRSTQPDPSPLPPSVDVTPKP